MKTIIDAVNQGKEDSRPLLVFIYVGKSLPEYALPSLSLAAEFSGCRIILVGNQSQAKQLDSISVVFVPIERFYDSSKFVRASRNVGFSQDFRKGFWLKTLERFFILEQFMEHGNLAYAMHAELDQLVFGVDSLIQRLESSDRSFLAFPFHVPSRGVASLFFANSLSTLQALNSFATGGEPFISEMDLLGNFAREFPNLVAPIPTLASVKKPSWLELSGSSFPAVLNYEELGGVADAAQLGLWVAGLDPRNIPLSQNPATKYLQPSDKYLLTRQDLLGQRFHMQGSELFVESEESGELIRVYNLHLHSKPHSELVKDTNLLRRLLEESSSNFPTVIPGMRRRQLFGKFSDAFNAAVRRIRAAVTNVWP